MLQSKPHDTTGHVMRSYGVDGGNDPGPLPLSSQIQTIKQTNGTLRDKLNAGVEQYRIPEVPQNPYVLTP